MPTAAPKPCKVCGTLVASGTRCPAHQVDPGTFGDARRGSRQSRGYGAHWDKLRTAILARDGGVCRCSECTARGLLLPAHAVDHIVSKGEWKRLHGSLDGVDAPTNLQAINRDCHQRKTQAEAQAARRRGRGV